MWFSGYNQNVRGTKFKQMKNCFREMKQCCVPRYQKMYSPLQPGTFDDICVCVQATSLWGEARVVNHSSAARVMDDMENKLDAKYLVTRER